MLSESFKTTISSTRLQFLGMPQMYDHFVICNRCCQYYKAFTRTRDGNKKKNHPLAPRGIPWPKQTTYLWDIWCITIIFFWITGDFFHLHLLAQKLNWTPAVERKETFPHLEDDFQSELSRPCTLPRVCSWFCLDSGTM